MRRSDFERHVAALRGARRAARLAPEVRDALLQPFLEERVLVLEARAARPAPRGGDAEEEEREAVRAAALRRGAVPRQP